MFSINVNKYYETCIITGLIIFVSNNLFANDNNYVNKIIERAISIKLNEDPYWLKLNHYRENIFNEYESEIDDPTFFNSPVGKNNPKLELIESLKAFFRRPKSSNNNLHAQCRFPAKFDFLDKKLLFDRRKILFLQCPDFLKWIQDLPQYKVVLSFPTYYDGMPATMFGHTLLYFKDKKQSNLMNFAVNYAAMVDIEKENPIKYVFMGIFGGYLGKFSLNRYYIKIAEYNELENRDIWEYELNLKPHEIRKIYLHLWELQSTFFEYYYFKENCSYHLLSLLEIARPELDLQSHYTFWATPAETIKQIHNYDLVDKKVYLPSRRSIYKNRYDQLNIKEKIIVDYYIENNNFPSDYAKLYQKDKLKIIDTLSDFYRVTKEKNKYLILIKIRKEIKIISSDLNKVPYSTSPELGHSTSRYGLSLIGMYEKGQSIGINFRLSYHDLLSKDEGYLPNSQIEIISGEFRKERNNVLDLYSLNIISVISLKPIQYHFNDYSWKVNLSIDPIYSEEKNDNKKITLNYGLGYAFYLNKVLFFPMFELKSSKINEGINENGILFSLGSIIKIKKNYKILFSLEKELYFHERDEFDNYKIDSNYSFFTDYELRLSYLNTPSFKEMKISFNNHF